MQHFFVTTDQKKDGHIYIEGSDLNHLKNVLRMKPGEQIRVSDGDNHTYLCEILGFEENAAVLDILSEEELSRELSAEIILFQGLPKGDKMELVIQKAVELGVSQVIPVSMKRCVVRLDDKKKVKKCARWQEISKSAAKQSGRDRIPAVGSPMAFREAAEFARSLDVVLFPYELAEGMDHTRKILSGIRPGQSVGIFIGPEGGFAKEEAELMHEIGAEEISLGRRILRTETAGLCVLSALMLQLEE